MNEPQGGRPQPVPGHGRRLLDYLRQPVDGASLAVFRILFGVILLFHTVHYWRFIEPVWLAPPIHFTYFGFGWVQPWPGDGLYWHFGLMGLAAACITLGVLYRLSTVLFFLAFSYVFLLEQATYLNHFYLVVLLAFLLCWLPAHHAWALDARKLPVTERGVVPRWAPLSVMLFMEILLLYAGLVKLNADWLQGYPLKLWFEKRAHFAVIGPLLGAEWFALLSSYVAIALHLLGAPLLFFRKTRLAVVVAYAVFHLSNSIVWTIGIFPFITIAGTLMFFEPDWPRALAGRLRIALAPAPSLPRRPAGGPGAAEGVTLAVLAAFLAANVLVPLRPLLYPGSVAWTEEGHRFSWRMKLRDKHCRTLFSVRDPVTGRKWPVRPQQLLSPFQVRRLATPDMVLQLAHKLVPAVRDKLGVADPEVRALMRCSLNGRPYALLIDPMRDLAKVKRDLRPADWILPLDDKLKPGTVVVDAREGAPADGGD